MLDNSLKSWHYIFGLSIFDSLFIFTQKDDFMKKCYFLSIVLLMCFSCNFISFADSYYTIPQGKTLFANVLQGSTLESENPIIAGVQGNFINAHNFGNTRILVKRNATHVDTIHVNVCRSEGMKLCYTTPNTVCAGGLVTAYAITDTTVDAVKFFVNERGTVREIMYERKDVDGPNYIFSCSFFVNCPGSHLLWTSFFRDGLWSESPNGETDIFVVNTTQSTALEHRVSDNCMQYITKKEGFHGYCRVDGLAHTSYDIGYGETINKGQIFYNNITPKEAYARLWWNINKGVYSRAVNNLLTNNNVKCTQNQFDALVSFTYNVGPSWTYSSDLKNIILKSGYSKFGYKGEVTSSNGLNLRSEPSTRSKILLAMRYKEEVDILDNRSYNGNWVKVSTKNGVVGYCSADYLSIKSVGSGEKDLSLIDRDLLANEFLQFHHVAKRCCKGLFYRRIEELQMFFHNNYSLDGFLNKFNFPVPTCIIPFLRG